MGQGAHIEGRSNAIDSPRQGVHVEGYGHNFSSTGSGDT